MSEMKKPVVRWGLGLAAALAVAFLATGAIRVGAQAPANGAGGPGEGITVHGHWTIDVRQPDGTLVTHRDFENALTYAGAGVLVAVLSRGANISNWSIRLLAGTVAVEDFSNDPCSVLPAGVSPAPCEIYEPNWYPNGPAIFGNLAVRGQFNPNALMLNGTATADRVGQVGAVQGIIATCDPLVTSLNCANPAQPNVPRSTNYFSAAAVVPPINVVANQLIQASVTYTFSAGAPVGQ
jgi:hypothetical protein